MPYIRIKKCVYKKKSNGSAGKKVGCSKNIKNAKKYLNKLRSFKESYPLDPELFIDSVNEVFSELPSNHKLRNPTVARAVLRKIYELFQKNDPSLVENPKIITKKLLKTIKFL